jgi:hypothetical protein
MGRPHDGDQPLVTVTTTVHTSGAKRPGACFLYTIRMGSDNPRCVVVHGGRRRSPRHCYAAPPRLNARLGRRDG